MNHSFIARRFRTLTLQIMTPPWVPAWVRIARISIGGNGNSGNSTPVSGGGGFTGAPGFSARTKKIEFFDDLARTAGKHNLKFGFMYVGDHQNWINGPAGCGGSSSFSSIQNFLQDIPGRVRMPVIEPYVPPGTVHHYRSKIIAGYAQDDWKMLSNLDCEHWLAVRNVNDSD